MGKIRNPRLFSQEFDIDAKALMKLGLLDPILNGDTWPAPGSEDTEFGVLMEPEVRHGAAEVYAGVQA